jgi:hypothetical protein
LELGIIPAGTELSQRHEMVQAWDALSADEQRLYARMMEIFAGFLAHTDHHIGRLINALKTLGDLDNTIIMLVSDNGASGEGGRTPITLGTGVNSVVGNFFMEQGGIVLPIKMSGSLKQPVFGLNTSLLQAKAREKLKDNLKESLVDQFLKKPGDVAADPNKQPDKPEDAKPAEKKPADLLKGVLDKLKKKEKP